VPLDLNGDGRDEIMAGYALLNGDGSVRWVLGPGKGGPGAGHLDCMRVLRAGENRRTSAGPHSLRSQQLRVVDRTGEASLGTPGHHYESITSGASSPISPARNSRWTLTIGRPAKARSRCSTRRPRLGQIITPSSRHHALLIGRATAPKRF